MKQTFYLLFLLPAVAFGQIISPSQIGVNSQTQYAPDGQHVGIFMYIGTDDSVPTLGYRTKAGYTYQLNAPLITDNFTGTAVSEEYVDSIISSIPSLRIGARLPGAQPNTVLYLDRGSRLTVDRNLVYTNDVPGSSVLSLNSDQGFSTTGSYRTTDEDGDFLFLAGEFRGFTYCYLQDISGNNYTGMQVSNDGRDVEFDMFTDLGGFTLQVDPNSGGALFNNTVESNPGFNVLDGSSLPTTVMGDGFVTTQTNDMATSMFIETSADGIVNHIGSTNIKGTVYLTESSSGLTWNMVLPAFASDAAAAAAGLTKFDLYQDPTGVVHVKH